MVMMTRRVRVGCCSRGWLAGLSFRSRCRAVRNFGLPQRSLDAFEKCRLAAQSPSWTEFEESEFQACSLHSGLPRAGPQCGLVVATSHVAARRPVSKF